MQTVASAAGTLSAIIFVLPGLIIVGWWTGFPFWISFAICAAGGILGVMYTIPLRRALVTDSDLPYPEGVACAEVLKVGAGHERSMRPATPWRPAAPGSRRSSSAASSPRSSTCSCRPSSSPATSPSTSAVGGERTGASGYDFSLSFALFAIGHLVGLSVGHRHAGGRAHRLGLGRAALHHAAPHGRPGRATRRRTAGATTCASSAPAPSASPPSGRWARS